MSIRITELDAITSLQSGDYIAVDNESTGTHKFDALNIGANIGQNIANTYSSSASYAIGQYCLYDNNLYKCTTTISTPEAWNSSHWIQVTVGEGLYEKVDKVSGKGLSTNDFTNEYKQKLGGIEAGAEVNVQADWTENDSSKDDYIKNKPGNATTSASGFMSASDKQKLDNIEAGAEVNVQPNWAEDDSSKDDYIKNKPTIDTALSTSSDNAVRNSAITAGINQVQGNLDTEITNRQNAVSGEQLARENADSALDGRLDTVEETLPNKANIDGSYDSMTVGNAEQLTTDIRANDQTPYLFRTSGGSVDIGDREYINGIVGGTVAFNQLVKNGNFASADGWEAYGGTVVISNGKLTFTATEQNNYAYVGRNDLAKSVINHIYISSAYVTVSEASTKVAFSRGGVYADRYFSLSANTKTKCEKVFKATAEGTAYYIYPMREGSGIAVGSTMVVEDAQNIDLTQLFGSTIADYIYSLEQANAGAGVAFFKTLFPKPYYAYNAGELMSVKGLVSHDMVGFNAFDKDTMFLYGYISDETGEVDQTDPSSGYRCTDFIKVVPNQTYYIKSEQTNGMWGAWYDANKNFISGITSYANTVKTAPKEAYYVRLTIKTSQSGNPNTFCINLSWDGSEDGNYEPYQKWSYPLDSDLELRGIPKIENGNLYYDGDVYEPDGTVTRKYGIVDLGTLNWSYTSTNGMFNTQAITNFTTKVADDIVITRGYTNSGNVSWLNQPDKTYQTYQGRLWIKDSAYSDAASFKSAMDGVYCVFPLNTPTEESADPYNGTQIVDDFGTEEFVIDDTIDVPIPVGNNTDYPINLKAKVEMAPNSPDGDGDYIVRQTNGTNEYVALANNAIVGGLVTRCPEASGENGTYVLKATISGGTVTYSWEAE